MAFTWQALPEINFIFTSDTRCCCCCCAPKARGKCAWNTPECLNFANECSSTLRHAVGSFPPEWRGRQRQQRYRAIAGTRTRAKTKLASKKHSGVRQEGEKSSRKQLFCRISRALSNTLPLVRHVPSGECHFQWVLANAPPVISWPAAASLLLWAMTETSTFPTWAVAVKGIHAAVPRVGPRSQTASFMSRQAGKRVCVCVPGDTTEGRIDVRNNQQPACLPCPHGADVHVTSVHHRTLFFKS